jgi:hypothetical protein
MSRLTAYGAVARWLHRIAFASWPIQAALGDVEEKAFAPQLKTAEFARPVFVAGLPRAGSTLLLELIESTGEFASYSYRDMPFLLAPMLWRRLSRSHRQAMAPRERAHGDGMSVNADSPEAFEEVVWRAFWPEHYRRRSITPWGARRDPEFDAFFRLQARKIIAIRRDERPSAARYLSKANGNIARLPYLRSLAPDAVVIVPFRDPVQQARSLLSQHLRFLEVHAQDPFARRYMSGIGHYDFGSDLRPIDFGGWLASNALDPGGLDFWLAYWTQAYGAVLDQDTTLDVLSYEAFCEAPREAAAALGALLGLQDPAALEAHVARVHPPRAPAEPVQADASLLADARRVHDRLMARSVVGSRAARATDRAGRPHAPLQDAAGRPARRARP